VFACECATGTGFQVAFEFSGALTIAEGDSGFDRPRFEF